MGLRNRLLVTSLGLVTVAVIAGVFLLLTPGENSLARAAESLDGQNVRLHVQMGFVADGEAMAMAGTAIQNADATKVKMDVKTSIDDGEAMEQTIMLIGDHVWVGGPEMEEVLPEGKRWMHAVDSTGAANTMAMDEFADFLRGADEIEDKGETVIRGKPVTQYQGHVNVRELAKETGGETAKRYADAIGGRDLFMPIDVWVDKDGRVARLSMTVDAGADSMSMTGDILEYGVPVDIKAPPESESISEAEFDRLTAG